MIRRLYIFIAIFVLGLMPAHGFGGAMDGRPFTDGASYVVVIDAGHGGMDTGALGSLGTKEKTVNLDVALKVAAKLGQYPGIKVLLTRNDDTFVPLHERAAFANASMADCFISIHSNAALSKAANGVETFFLSVDATDSDARDIAALENAVVTSEGDKAAAQNDDIKAILFDLTMTESHHESSVLADTVQASLYKAIHKENRGVKQAPFVVLNGAMMPAALVEIGFISNKAEEKRLLSNDEQAKIADSITEGILDFKKITERGRRIDNSTAKKD